MLGTLAILGMPPFGVFASEFLILTTAMREQPWATPFLLVALGVAFAAIFAQGAADGVRRDHRRKRLPHPPALLPVFVHLALVLMLGLWIPPYLADWYRQAARADRMNAHEPSRDLGLSGATLPVARCPHRRVPVELPASCWRPAAGVASRRPAGRAVGQRRARPRSRAIACTSSAGRRRPDAARAHAADADVRLSRPRDDLSRGRPDAARRVRPAGHSRSRCRRPAALAAATATGPTTSSRCATTSMALPKWEPGAGGLSVRAASTATACTRSRSARCMPASSSRDTSASPIVGEKVLRLEERLGYMHKGIEKRFEAHDARARAHRLAGRISRRQHGGLCLGLCAWRWRASPASTPPPRALWLRALLLERERVANHLGDLGYLGNDGGFAFGLAQFSRLKEDVLRTNAAVFGHRYLMDHDRARRRRARPDASDCARASATNARRWSARCGSCATSTTSMPACRTASRTCGIVTPGTGGAARPDRPGRPRQRRRRATCACDFPVAPYDQLDVRMAGTRNGDVAARVAVRFDEMLESLRLIREHRSSAMPEGEMPRAPADAAGKQLGHRLGRRLARRVLVALDSGAGRQASAAAIRTIRRGRTGRCWNTR